MLRNSSWLISTEWSSTGRVNEGEGGRDERDERIGGGEENRMRRRGERRDEMERIFRNEERVGSGREKGVSGGER